MSKLNANSRSYHKRIPKTDRAGNLLPNPVKSLPIMQRVMRYQCITGATDVDVRVQDMLSWLLVSTNAAGSTCHGITAAFRLKRVAAWACGDSTTGPNDLVLTAGGVTSASGISIPAFSMPESVVAVGTEALPPHLSWTPDPETFAGMWHGPGDTKDAILFKISSLQVGDIVDVSFEYMTMGNQATTGTSTNITGSSWQVSIATPPVGIHYHMLGNNVKLPPMFLTTSSAIASAWAWV